jgi:hypothetical protein
MVSPRTPPSFPLPAHPRLPLPPPVLRYEHPSHSGVNLHIMARITTPGPGTPSGATGRAAATGTTRSREPVA